MNPGKDETSATALKILSIMGCHQKIKDCFLICYLAVPRPNLTLMFQIKKNYMLTTNLATNAGVVFKLFIVSYHINFKSMIRIQI